MHTYNYTYTYKHTYILYIGGGGRVKPEDTADETKKQMEGFVR